MTHFEIVKKFCDDKNCSKLTERIIFHKFMEDYNNLIISFKNNEKQEPSADILRGFESTLLSASNLSTYVKLANEELKENLKKELDGNMIKHNFMDFMLSILSSFIASVLFTLLLVWLFSAAQSQIKTWVGELYENQSAIEKTVKGKK